METLLDGESSGVLRPRSNTYNNKEIGKFTVCCGGSLVIPPGWCGSLFAWGLILIPSTLQIAFVNSQFDESIAIDAAYLSTMTLSLLFLFITTFTDPGILPREDPNQTRQELRDMFIATSEDLEVDHVAVVKGKEILCMKCRTCNIYRPPRSFHCSEC